MLAAEASRSTGWVWVVVGGFVVGLVLLWHVVSSAVATLPDEIRDRLRGSLRANSRPIVVTGVVFTWTLAYLLYSVATVPVGFDQQSPTAAPASAVSAGDAPTTSPTTTAVTVPTPGAPVVTAPGAAAPTPVGGAGTARPAAAPAGPTIHDANLFTSATNTQGITGDTIHICGHAPLSYGALLNTKPEDLLVYWRWLNDHGGVYGHKFDVSLVDDKYTPEGAIPAANECAEKKPFMIFGALGSDVIPPVRVWAEQHREFYMYGFTVRKGSERLRYSFTGTVQQEDMSRLIADLAARKFPGKKVGLLWRNSANFQPGRDAFLKRVAQNGGQVVADLPIQKNQGAYTQEILTLRQKGAEVVFALEDALTQLNIVKQAKTQQYSPQWLLFTYNMQTKTLGDDALNPPIQGANLSPAYECHQYGGPYASYGAEIKTFEEAYAKYSPNTDLCGITGDLAWQGWVGFKAYAELFQMCGPSCTRNRMAGMLEGGLVQTFGAACVVDFRGDGHHGAVAADVMEAYRGPNGAAYRNTQRCVRTP